MDPESGINYPSEEKKNFSQTFYIKIRQRITDNLRGIDWNDEYVNSLLAVMEANLSYVPSSTAKAELADISLFDHVKFTAAVASCIYDYLNAGKKNCKDELFTKEKEFYDRQVFFTLLFRYFRYSEFYLYNYFPKCITYIKSTFFLFRNNDGAHY